MLVATNGGVAAATLARTSRLPVTLARRKGVIRSHHLVGKSVISSCGRSLSTSPSDVAAAAEAVFQPSGDNGSSSSSSSGGRGSLGMQRRQQKYPGARAAMSNLASPQQQQQQQQGLGQNGLWPPSLTEEPASSQPAWQPVRKHPQWLEMEAEPWNVPEGITEADIARIEEIVEGGCRSEATEEAHHHQQQQHQPEVEEKGIRGRYKHLSMDELQEHQVKMEVKVQEEAVAMYTTMMEDMTRLGRIAELGVVQQELLSWYGPLVEALEREQEAVWNQTSSANVTIRPLLVLLRPEKLAVMTMHEVMNRTMRTGYKGSATVEICTTLAEAIQAELNVSALRSNLGASAVTDALSRNVHRHVRALNLRAKRALDTLEYTEWSKAAGCMLGAYLTKVLMDTSRDTVSGEAAFYHEVIWEGGRQRLQGRMFLNPTTFDRFLGADDSFRVSASMQRVKPMVVPPAPWTKHNQGAYLVISRNVMRTRGSGLQRDILRNGDLGLVMKGLNALGQVPWQINEEVYDVICEANEKGLQIGDLPPHGELPVPKPEPMADGVEGKEGGLDWGSDPNTLKAKFKKFNARARLRRRSVSAADDVAAAARVGEDEEGEEEIIFTAEEKEVLARRKAHRTLVRKVKTRNSNVHSLRCDMKLKLDIAGEMLDYPAIYFPYSLDFRGRAYPIPPNLNHMGNDLCRGVLTFKEERPLGETGLFWLKVHVANVFGQDKLSFDGRVAFVDSKLDQIRDSAANPLGGKWKWWQEADSPWQCLAACKELSRALDSPDPRQFMSKLPVHQDGSCNGLQHYAALSRDEAGGSQVNLTPGTKPADVYSGVSTLVAEKVHQEAVRELPPGATDEQKKTKRVAQLVDGLIDRKVVKQTVMTSVYGVTFVGARGQIQARLKEKLEKVSNRSAMEVDFDADLYYASVIVARLTMDCLGELFQEARRIMDWLGNMAGLVGQQGEPMGWVTPLGLPVLQPYRRTKGAHIIETVLQTVSMVEDDDTLPVSLQRQRSAFPPNFVHSLDASHMLMTALEMDRKNLPFAAVHDSYWAHAGSVDEMNVTLRQAFVDLYEGPILEDLHTGLSLRFPNVDFPPVPKHGKLDLQVVKDSPYFFN